ncbi:hypothetical protein DJ568_16385 [Mucilaginibacter hurinus]|uniref:Outer membrane protein beta-barrel domain-containing protein n=1 Tax=Mucilaginibacter hurinus TaxID=2201324 RepID=A0A367GK07_9SPHI|nr:hypothetical protein [Mucilaginibacter hurinus]RCH53814.1 hypothetical protein DJ568_16385 [Mucilaginibacter hurinus]
MRLFGLLAFTLLPFACFSQSNYKKGYILRSSGDTLRGYIDSREWARNPKFIAFKTSMESANVLRFKAVDIIRFQIFPYTNYVSYVGHISNNRNRFPEIDDFKDTTTRLDTIFLKQLFKGNNLALYAHIESAKDRFFYQEEGQQPVEFKYFNYRNTDGQLSQGKIYIGQLTLLLNKYAGGDKRKLRAVQQAHFNEGNLIRVFELIDGTGAENRNRPAGSRLFVGGGLNYINTAFYGENRFAESSPSKTYSPKVSAGYDFFINPIVQQFFFRTELSLHYVKPNFSRPVSSQAYVSYTFDQYNLALTPQLIYNVYNKESFKFYIGAGAAINYSIYANNKMTMHNTAPYNQPAYRFENLWLSFPLQAGVTVNKRFDISLNRSGAAAFTRYLGFSVASEVWGISLKYLFDRNREVGL